MSIDDKLAEFEKIKADTDMRVLMIADALHYDPAEFFGLFDENQRGMLVEEWKKDRNAIDSMITETPADLIGAAIELYTLVDDPMKFVSADLANAYLKLSEERRKEIRESGYVSNAQAKVLMVYGDFKGIPILNFDGWMTSEKMNYKFPDDKEVLITFLEQFNSLDEEVQEMTVKGLIYSRLSAMLREGEFERLQKVWEGNPYRFAALHLYDQCMTDQEFEPFSKNDPTQYAAVARAWVRNKDHLKMWMMMEDYCVSYRKYDDIFSVLKDIDPKIVEKADEIRSYVPEGEEEAFMDGLLNNVRDGTAEQWLDYVWGQITKDTVGGGNYRTLFERELV